jgi:hypothetical protein
LNDAIIFSGFVAIVLQLDLDLVGQARFRNPFPGESELLLADCQTRNTTADLAGGELREATPATNDLQHMVAGPMPVSLASARYLAAGPLSKSFAPVENSAEE